MAARRAAPVTAPKVPSKRTLQKQSVQEQRVNTIVDMMVQMAWSPTDSARLAEQWGVHITCVRRLAAEASRQIKAHVRLHEEGVREELVAGFRYLAAQGRVAGQISASVKALDALAKIYGVYAPESHSVTHRIDHMSEAELAEFEKKLVRDLKGKGK